jgi:hypothetical protein
VISAKKWIILKADKGYLVLKYSTIETYIRDKLSKKLYSIILIKNDIVSIKYEAYSQYLDTFILVLKEISIAKINGNCHERIS